MGLGVAFKQHLLYKIISVEYCGGIEQQFSMLVLTLYPGLQPLNNDVFLCDLLWCNLKLTARNKTKQAPAQKTTGIKHERIKIVRI